MEIVGKMSSSVVVRTVTPNRNGERCSYFSVNSSFSC